MHLFALLALLLLSVFVFGQDDSFETLMSSLYTIENAPVHADDTGSSTCRVTASSLRIRSSPNGAIIGSLSYGAQVSLISNVGRSGSHDWSLIETSSRRGYVATSYLQCQSHPQPGGSDAATCAIRFVRSKLGKAYASLDVASKRMGQPCCNKAHKCSDECYDCSSLLYMAYTSCGKRNFPTYTGAYPANGNSLLRIVTNRNDIQPGDILHRFGKNGGVGHVGIYIGNGRMIHASSSTTGVIESPVNYMECIYRVM